MSAVRLLTESLLSISGAARKFPSNRKDGSVRPETVWRWMHRGIRTSDGRTVKLESLKVGVQWLTSSEALGRFVAELNSGSTPVADVPKLPRSVQRRQRASERALKQLDHAEQGAAGEDA